MSSKRKPGIAGIFDGAEVTELAVTRPGRGGEESSNTSDLVGMVCDSATTPRSLLPGDGACSIVPIVPTGSVVGAGCIGSCCRTAILVRSYKQAFERVPTLHDNLSRHTAASMFVGL